MFVVPERAEPVALGDVDVEIMASVLAHTAVPIEQDALAAFCDIHALEALVELGILKKGTHEDLAPRATAPTRKRCKRLVVGVSGAVAAAGALDHVVALADHFAERVDVVLTQGATRFVQPRVYEYYGFPVWTDAFEPANGVAVNHRELAMNADLVVVAPASANTLHRLATGACSDLLSLVVAMTKSPVVVAPSMNADIWSDPPNRRKLAPLRRDGVWVVETAIATPIAARETRGLGAPGFDLPGLMRALDAILTLSAPPAVKRAKTRSSKPAKRRRSR